MASLKEKTVAEELRQELEWARTRVLWLQTQKAHFKKEGGGEWKPKDLITLSFDKEEEVEKPMSFQEAKAQLGSRIKRDGK